MEMRTQSGLKITIFEEEGLKVISFNKPIKATGLTKEESIRLGTMLMRDVQTGITAEIRKLINEGFFKRERRFGEIKKELLSRGVPVKSASLNIVLNKMVEKNELLRTGEPRSYLYRQNF
ncbi:MAG: hypothetical protein ACE5K4_04955 [Candidatus Hydrothermarchaeota archaeon]